MTKTIYFIDEDEVERRSSVDVLREIFASESLRVEAQAPLPLIRDYAALVTDPDTAALIVDQRLDTNGMVSYTGIQVAAFLRTIASKLPIVILTNYPNDDFGGLDWTVEQIFEKTEMLRDPAAKETQEWKARLIRQIDVFEDVRGAREERFHNLLVKSLQEKLSPAEETELGLLETERILPVQAQEIHDIKLLEDAIDELRKRLHSDDLPLE
jgi:hypothetical protein